jgi:poly(3-hydroxybutyrate) depolymerase
MRQPPGSPRRHSRVESGRRLGYKRPAASMVGMEGAVKPAKCCRHPPAADGVDSTAMPRKLRLSSSACWWITLHLGPLALLIVGGCAVPQPRGSGKLQYVTEPSTKRGYWLYLPRAYVETDEVGRQRRRWPVVVTFHGMKPFDSAYPQACEWQQEADRYGFIVVAPELVAPDVLRQFPVRSITPAFASDAEATLAILDHVFATTCADRQNVLVTSWSSGGYLAHYMLNRYPERFTCLAVRQSNFSDAVLDPRLTPRSRDHPLLILTTQNDFGGVKQETREAIRWYEGHGYTNFGWVEIKGLGHERTPDTAAAFFAKVAGVEPSQPPTVLTHRQAIAGNPRGLALLTPRADQTAMVAAQKPEPATAASPVRPATREPGTGSLAAANRPTPPRPVAPPPEPLASTTGGVMTSSSGGRPTQAVAAQTPRRPAPPRSPVSIRVSSAIGVEPLVLAFSAECPADWLRTADFLWTLNGEPIASGPNGQKTITQPGEHTLGLLVVTANGAEYRVYRLIRVLAHIDSARSAGSASP